MKNLAKGALATGVVALTNVQSYAAVSFGRNNVDDGIKGSTESVDTALQQILSVFFTFLYLIAVLYAVWGGFNILTAGGDEEKVKKGKTILIQAILGLIVIFLASSIIEWVVVNLLSAG